PTEASEWLFRMEDMLEDLGCTPAEKVTFATRYFRVSASNWWHGTKEYMATIEVEMNRLEISCDLRDRIIQAQMNDPDLQRRINNPKFSIAADGAILYSGRLCKD
ncbi:hypothetical protein A2U01_0050147, partial [Trifolium medium]|nr:hypothetical protein [Trifolium medium]